MKRKLITAMVIGLMIFGVQMSFVVDSFPGFHSNGDCTLCHNNPATAYNESYVDMDITVDGIDDEEFWQVDTWGRRVMVPIAGRFGGGHSFLSVIFAQNSTHFFVIVNWEDETIDGTDTQAYDDSDGLSIMFNINVTDFDTGYGMDRAPGNTAVDMITWKPAASADGTETFGNGYVSQAVAANTYNEHIFDDSRDDDASNDWTVAGIHGNVSDHNEHNYQVEFARPLVTNDPNDVQFDESKYYEFGIVRYNNSAGSSHWISPVHSVFVYNAADTDAPLITVTDNLTDTVTQTETADGTTETVTADPVTNTVTKTQTETEGKEPLAILPVMLALFAVPVIVLLRRKT